MKNVLLVLALCSVLFANELKLNISRIIAVQSCLDVPTIGNMNVRNVIIEINTQDNIMILRGLKRTSYYDMTNFTFENNIMTFNIEESAVVMVDLTNRIVHLINNSNCMMKIFEFEIDLD